VETVPVTDGRGLDRFIAFPFDLHRHDPLWVPPLRRDVRTLLTPGRNPFFQHGEARCFLAVRDGRTVGRIAAIRNDEHQRVHHDKVGFYGFFESVDDQPVATALFDTAAAWLRTKGFDTMRGPMSPSINDECGLLVDGFDTPPVIMMTHNPRYYVPLHERYGFVKAKDLIAYEGSGTAPPERIVRAAQLLAERKGITLRPLNMKRFREEVTLVKSLFNRAWEHNWGFIPMTEAELDFLADQLKPIIIPDMVCIAELKGTVVGFGLAIPDMNAALRHNRSGRLFPLGLVRILWYSRRNHRARIPLLGTVPEFRGRGVDALMYHWIWTRSNAHGFTWGEAGWFLEDNHAIINAAVHLGFHAYKTYRIYDKPL
jgi:GNAT superfamily N-acetyltransferase